MTLAFDPDLHDPATCTREACRRCGGPYTPQAPEITANPHHARSAKPQPPTLGGVSPNQLHHLLTDLAKTIDTHGAATWQYVDDWRKEQRRVNDDSTRGGGSGEHAAVRARDRREDDRVGLLFDRLTAAVTSAADALVLVDALVRETIPLRMVKTKPNLRAAQAAADGWCRSCFRDDQHLEPITTRPDGTPFFRDLCKWCGYWQAEHGQLPSIDVLQQRHSGRRIRRTA